MKVEPEERLKEKKTVDEYGRIYIGRDRKLQNLEIVLKEEKVDGELSVSKDEVIEKTVNSDGRISVGRGKSGESFFVYILESERGVEEDDS